MISGEMAVPQGAVVGTKFFDGYFEDAFIPRANWDDANIRSVQIEATLGYVNLLYQTALITSDQAERNVLIQKADFFMRTIEQFHTTYSKHGGIPYSTRSISGVQTTLESIVASDTYRAVHGIMKNPALAWTFIGASQDPVVAGTSTISTPQGDTLTGQTSTGELSPNSTYVFDRSTGTVISPEGRMGVQPYFQEPPPSFIQQVKDDYYAFMLKVDQLISRIKDDVKASLNYAPSDVMSWQGNFVDAPQWILPANVQQLPELSTLDIGVDYRAEIKDGRLYVYVHKPINLTRIPELPIKWTGQEYNMVVLNNQVIITPSLTGLEADKYQGFSYLTQRIFHETQAPPIIRNLSDFPELSGAQQGQVFTGRINNDQSKLLVYQQQPDGADQSVSFRVSDVLGQDFHAPANTQFTISVNEQGQLVVNEQVQLASIFQNPWSPNIPLAQLPQFLAGLQRTGHTQLYVSTNHLVQGMKIQDVDSRTYFTTLVRLASQYGIEVYAYQGSPDWITADGKSRARLYMKTLGYAGIDFAGYVLDIQPQLSVNWSQASEQNRNRIAARFSETVSELEEIMHYYAGNDRDIQIVVPSEMRNLTGYQPVANVNDILVIDETDVDAMMQRIEEFNPTRPFRIKLETSVMTSAQHTFAMNEGQMASAIQEITERLRQDERYGQNFQGVVINHDTGEDILHVMRDGEGRNVSERMQDGIYQSPDNVLMLTRGAYEMIVSGEKPRIIHVGEDLPEASQIGLEFFQSRVEAMMRGITGAANVHEMFMSLVETIKRNQLTISHEAIPLGAELGTLVAGGNIAWGFQYSDVANINNVEIIGVNANQLDANGQPTVVARWDNVINSSDVVEIGKNSSITHLQVRVRIAAGTELLPGQTFTGYVMFLTHHPDNAGIVTEQSSEPFDMVGGAATDVTFSVPVSREGFNDFSFMLMSGKKLAKEEVVIDHVGFGHRFEYIAEWVQNHSGDFQTYYTNNTANAPQLSINQMGLWSGVLDSRVVLRDFDQRSIDVTTPAGQQTVRLLAQSGVNELTLDANTLIGIMDNTTNPEMTVKVLVDFMSALRSNNIRVSLMVGNPSGAIDDVKVRANLLELFRMKLPINGFVLTAGTVDSSMQEYARTLSDYVIEAGYGQIVLVNGADLRGYTSQQSVMTAVNSAVNAGRTSVIVPFQNIGDLNSVMSVIPAPTEDQMNRRAAMLQVDDLERFVLYGRDNLSRVEQLLMDFSRLKRLPRVQLGETAAQVELVTPQNIYVNAGGTPYISLHLTDAGDMDVGRLTAIIELQNINTGERIEGSFPLILPRNFDERINIPIENLEPGQWRYRVSVIPEYFERDRAFVPATPVLSNGSTIPLGNQQVTVMPGDRDTGRRIVKVNDLELTLIDRTDGRSSVIYDGQEYIMEDVLKGVDIEIGPTKLQVHVSRDSFNQWALETGGEEVSIRRFENFEEVLTVGVPHQSKVLGHIQVGLPDIEVSNTTVEIDDRFIEDQASRIHYVTFEEPFDVDGHKVTITIQKDGMVLAVVEDPTGKVQWHAFHSTSSDRALRIGKSLVMLGSDGNNRTVAAISRYTTARVSFDVSNTMEATSPITYMPEITFYHPLIGEVSIPSEEKRTINVGDTQHITMEVPVPSDFLAQDKLKLYRIMGDVLELRTGYQQYLRDKDRDRDAGIAATTIQQDLHKRFIQTQRETLAAIRAAQQIIGDVQGKHLMSAVHYRDVANLDARITELNNIYRQIERLQVSKFERAELERLTDILAEAEYRLNNLMADLGSLSTQRMGYKVSVHDVANLMGEHVYIRGSAIGAGGIPQGEIIARRPVLVDPIFGFSVVQDILRIGKDPYSQVMTGVITPAVIEGRHIGYMSQASNHHFSVVQWADLMRDYFRIKNYNLPASRLAVDKAQQDLSAETTNEQRALTRDVTSMFFEVSNMMKTADIRAGRPFVVGYAETVVEGEKLIYDASTDIIVQLLGDLQKDDSLALKSDLMRFLTDLGQLFRLIEQDGVTANEAMIIVGKFLENAPTAERQHAMAVIESILKDNDRTNRQKAGFIVLEILETKGMRQHLTDLSFQRMRENLARENAQVLDNFTRGKITASERNQQLSRIRGMLAYMSLAENHRELNRLVEEANHVSQMGGDPVSQAAEARLTYQKALGDFLVLIGLETESAPVTDDISSVITRVQRSNIPAVQRDHALTVLRDMKQRMDRYSTFLADRRNAMDDAQNSLSDRRTDVTSASQLLERTEGNITSHKSYMERITADYERQFIEWQSAIRRAPSNEAVPRINEVLTSELGHLQFFISELRRTELERYAKEQLISNNNSEIASLRLEHQQSASDVEKLRITQQIRLLEEANLEASSVVDFAKWYLPFLTQQMDRVSEHITEMQGALLALGQTPDVNFFQRQIDSVRAEFQKYAGEESSLSKSIASLESAKQQWETQRDSILAKYNYHQRMKTVGSKVQLSTVLTDALTYIRNPDSYFEYLSMYGFNEVYVEHQELLDAKGNVDVQKLAAMGRVIQSARQHGLQVKILIRGDSSWARSRNIFFHIGRVFGITEREGTAAARNLTENLTLLQQKMFDYDVYVDGFALDMQPVMSSDGRYNISAYQSAREVIADVIDDAGEDFVDKMRDEIKKVRQAGDYDRALQMEQYLSRMIGEDGKFHYAFDVFEDERVAQQIDSYLKTRYDDPASHRISDFSGRSVVVNSSLNTDAIRSTTGLLQSQNHGISINWGERTYTGREEMLPLVLENIVSQVQSQDSGLQTVFVNTENVITLQRSLNALGAVPLSALDLLQTQEDLDSAYNQRVVRYIIALKDQLSNLKKVLDEEREFRSSTRNVIQNVIDNGVGVQMPESWLAADRQFSALETRIADIERRLKLDLTTKQADQLRSDIDELYKDVSANVRRLRLSLSGMLSAEGFTMDLLPDVTRPGSNLLGGRSVLSFNLGQLVQNAPVGFMVSYQTQDGKQEQRDLLREIPSLRQQVERMRDAAIQFAQMREQIESLDLNLQQNHYDVSMLRRGIDIASRTDAQIKPVTVSIDGRKVTIQGNVFQGLDQVDDLLEQLNDRREDVRLNKKAFEQTLTLLRARIDAMRPDAKDNFITRQDEQEPAAVHSLDYARNNQSLAQTYFDQAQNAKKVADQERENARIGLAQAEDNQVNATRNVTISDRNVAQHRQYTEAAFIDLLEALTGKRVSRNALFQTEVGDVGVRIQLDQASDDLRKAYFNFDTIFHRLYRIFASRSTQADFNQVMTGYTRDRVMPGWGLDAVLGPGSPYVGIDENEASSVGAELVRAGIDAPASISLYGGLFKISWHWANPEMATFSVNLRPAEDSVVGKAQFNVLQRQSQYILTQMVMQDRRENVRNAAQHFEKMMNAYHEHQKMLELHKEALENARESLTKAQQDYVSAQQFFDRSQNLVDLAQRNLSNRTGDLAVANKTLDQIIEEGEDDVTVEEMKNNLSEEGTPQITSEQRDSTIKATPPDMGEEFERTKIVTRFLALFVYGLVGFIGFAVGGEKLRNMMRGILLARAKRRAAEVEKGTGRSGFLGGVLDELHPDRISAVQMRPLSGKRALDPLRGKPQFSRLLRAMDATGVNTISIIGKTLREMSNLILYEELGVQGPQEVGRERIQNLPRMQKAVYFSRLYLRLAREKYHKYVLNTLSVRMLLHVSAILLGLFILPSVGIPPLPFELINTITSALFGTNLFNPILFGTTVQLPWFFWVPFLMILPNLLYFIPVMISVVWGIAKLSSLVTFFVGKWVFGKVFFVLMLPVHFAATAGKVLFNGFASGLNKVMGAAKIKTSIPTIESKKKDEVEKWKDKTYQVSYDFGQRAIEKAREFATENGLGTLEEMPKAEAQKLIDSFILDEAAKNARFMLLQDEGNFLRVNVQKAVDTIETSPGIYGFLPAIYVPFYVPDPRFFNKWFWGIMIQNLTQSIQYTASMAMRTLRGTELGANVAHPVFSHVISKSELDIASFVFHVQGRWLVGHIHVVRPELTGQRIALNVTFEPLELEKKTRPDGTLYRSVEEFVNDLTNRGVELPPLDANIFAADGGVSEITVEGLENIPGVDAQAIQQNISDTISRVIGITAGYFRSFPDERNPYYGTGHNATHHNKFPEQKDLQPSDLEGLGTFEPTENFFYSRSYYFGTLTYLPGGVSITGEDGSLSIAPTGRIAKYDFNLGSPGTKARNLNALLLVLQGYTYMKREVIEDADGKKHLKVHFQDIDKEYFPEIDAAKKASKEDQPERVSALRRAYYDIAKPFVKKLYDNATGSVVPVNLGTRLGFEPYAGMKGALARWKAKTLGMLIGIVPVSLFGLIQDPINAALQGYYDPAFVAKTAEAQSYLNSQAYSVLKSRYEKETDALSGATISLQGYEYTVPGAVELVNQNVQREFADNLYQIADMIGIHIPRDIFMQYEHLLTNSHESLLPFFMAVEKDRIARRREAVGGTVETWEKGLAEAGTVLVNVQQYLMDLSKVFVTRNAQNAVKYLATQIGAEPARNIRVDIIENSIPQSRDFDERTAYMVGLYNRQSGIYSAAYNRVAGLTYHGSHETDVQRSGALERQLGDLEAEERRPIMNVAEDKSDLQSGRSWCKISLQGPERIYHLTSQAKSVSNWQINEQMADALMYLIEVSSSKGTPIDRIVVYDQNGGVPFENPDTWRIAIVSDSGKLTTPQQVGGLLKEVLKQPRYQGLSIPVDRLTVINTNDFAVLDQFKLLSANGQPLDNFDARMARFNKKLLQRILSNLSVLHMPLGNSLFVLFRRLFFASNPSKKLPTWVERMEQMADKMNTAGLLTEPKQQKRYQRVKNIIATKKRFDSFMNSLVYENKQNMFHYLISWPIQMMLRSGFVPAIGLGLGLFFGLIPPLLGLPLILFGAISLYNVIYALSLAVTGLSLRGVDLSHLSTRDKVALLDGDEYVALKESLGLVKADKLTFRPLGVILDAIRGKSPLFADNLAGMISLSEQVKSGVVNGISITPSTVDEEYVTSAQTAEDAARGFQWYNYSQTELEPAIEDWNQEFADRGTAMINNMIRMSEENPEKLMNAVNKYIEYRKMVEAPLGSGKVFEYVTLKDIKNLQSLSAEIREKGFLYVTSDDLAILGRVFGMNKEMTLDALSGFWSEAKWPVVAGIPMFPGTTKGRIRLATRGGTKEDARAIPVMAALMTLAEPPWLGPLSAFNLMETNADEPAEALAEDTLFGIKGMYNPEDQPETPAIAVHLRDFIEYQYERRMTGEESVKRAAAFGKGMSMMYGVNAIMEHPFFQYGISMEDRVSWRQLMDNLFDAKAFNRDEVSYAGVGRGTGWINYIIFGYTLYGHLPKRVGPFPPGLSQAYRTMRTLFELDKQLDGRLFKIIRWIQLTRPDQPIANGQSMVDYRVAASIAKAFGDVPNGNGIVDELLQNAVGEFVKNYPADKRHLAIKALRDGDRLFGHTTVTDEVLNQAADQTEVPAVEEPVSQPDFEEIDTNLSGFYTADEIRTLKDTIRNIPVSEQPAALRRILDITQKPVPGYFSVLKQLWKYKYTKTVPSKVLRRTKTVKAVGKAIKLALPILAVSLWGWWASLVPLFFLATEMLGLYRGSFMKRLMRFVLGFGGVVFYLFMVPHLAIMLTIPSALFLIGTLIGGRNAAQIVLYIADLFPRSYIFMSNILKRNSYRTFYRAYKLHQDIKEHQDIHKDVILSILSEVSGDATSLQDFNLMLEKRIILQQEKMRLTKKLMGYYNEAETRDILEALEKFDIGEQVKILQRVSTKARLRLPGMGYMARYLLKPKAGEELDYSQRGINFINRLFTEGGLHRINTVLGLGTIAGVYVALFGTPVGILQILTLAGGMVTALILGTKTFRGMLASISAVIAPLVFVSVYGLSARFMPILIVGLFTGIGYLSGGTLGMFLENLPEMMHNSLLRLAKVVLSPFRIPKLLSSNYNERKQLIASLVRSVASETESAKEFISVFETEYVAALERLRPLDQTDDGANDDGTGVDRTPPPTPTGGGTPGILPTETPQDTAPAAPSLFPSQYYFDALRRMTFALQAGQVRGAVAIFEEEIRDDLQEAVLSIIKEKNIDLTNPLNMVELDKELTNRGFINGIIASQGIVSTSSDQAKLIFYLNNRQWSDLGTQEKFKIALLKYIVGPDAVPQPVDQDTLERDEYFSIQEDVLMPMREGILHPHLDSVWSTYPLVRTLRELRAQLIKERNETEDPSVLERINNDITALEIQLSDMRNELLDFLRNTRSPLFLGDYIPQYGTMFEEMIKETGKTPASVTFTDLQRWYNKKYNSGRQESEFLTAVSIIRKLDEKHFHAKDSELNDYTVRILTTAELTALRGLDGTWHDNPQLAAEFILIDNSGIAVRRGIVGPEEAARMDSALESLVSGGAVAGNAQSELIPIDESPDVTPETNIISPAFKADRDNLTSAFQTRFLGVLPNVVLTSEAGELVTLLEQLRDNELNAFSEIGNKIDVVGSLKFNEFKALGSIILDLINGWNADIASGNVTDSLVLRQNVVLRTLLVKIEQAEQAANAAVTIGKKTVWADLVNGNEVVIAHTDLKYPALAQQKLNGYQISARKIEDKPVFNLTIQVPDATVGGMPKPALSATLQLPLDQVMRMFEQFVLSANNALVDAMRLGNNTSIEHFDTITRQMIQAANELAQFSIPNAQISGRTGSALKNIGDEDNTQIPEATMQSFREQLAQMRHDRFDAVKSFVINETPISSILMVSDVLPSNMNAYHFHDTDGALVIVMRPEILINRETDEAIFHEHVEASWIKRLSKSMESTWANRPDEVKRIAHILASAEQVTAFGSGKLTNYHLRQLNTLSAEQLNRLLSEDRSMHHHFIQSYLGNSVSEAVKRYESLIQSETRRLLEDYNMINALVLAMNGKMADGAALLRGDVAPMDVTYETLYAFLGAYNDFISKTDPAEIRSTPLFRAISSLTVELQNSQQVASYYLGTMASSVINRIAKTDTIAMLKERYYNEYISDMRAYVNYLTGKVRSLYPSVPARLSKEFADIFAHLRYNWRNGEINNDVADELFSMVDFTDINQVNAVGFALANSFGYRWAERNSPASLESTANILEKFMDRAELVGLANVMGGYESLNGALLKSIDKARVENYITPETYQRITDLLLIQGNEDLIALMALIMLGHTEVNDTNRVEVARMQNRIQQEIADYFASPDALKQVPVTFIEEPAVEIKVNKASVVYSQAEVDAIFRNFSPSDPSALSIYLTELGTKNLPLPSPMELYKNKHFQPMRSNGQAPKHVLSIIESIAREAGLNTAQMVRLLDVMERTQFVRGVTADKDVVMLDLDSFGLSLTENAGNVTTRRTLTNYIRGLMDYYDKAGRHVNLVVYSEKIGKVSEINTLLGDELLRLLNLNGNRIISRDLISEMFGQYNTPEERYMAFLLTLAKDYDINRVNLKVFSNQNAIMDVAGNIGAVLASREGTVFEAIKVFANLHPNKFADLKVRGTTISVRDLILKRGLNYLSIAGEEIALESPGNRPVPMHLRTIGNKGAIDNAA